MDRDELNAALAVELFGWHEWTDFLEDDYDGPYPCFARWTETRLTVYEDEESGDPTRHFDALTYEGMGMVLEKMREDGYASQLEWQPRERCWCQFIHMEGKWPTHTSEACDTLPEAVARAALAAKRKEKAP